MLSQRRVFAVKPLGGRDRAGEALAHGCIVPGVTSTCRRILDTEDGGTPHLPEGGGEPRTLQRQVPPPTLASWDSGVEMVAGDSSLAAFPGLSQDSLNMEPMGSPEPQALAAPEPPSQLGQLLASRKLEQVLEQSQGRAHLSTQHCALPAAPWSRPGCVLAAEAELEGGPGGSRGAAVVPRAWACLPGQGLRYLEHLCLVLEQMARLQQLYLELRTQSPPAFLDLEEEEPVLDPLPSLPPAPGSGVQGSEELLSLTEETGLEAASCSEVRVLSVNPPRLPEVPVELADSFPPSQGRKDLSHWNSQGPAQLDPLEESWTP